MVVRGRYKPMGVPDPAPLERALYLHVSGDTQEKVDAAEKMIEEMSSRKPSTKFSPSNPIPPSNPSIPSPIPLPHAPFVYPPAFMAPNPIAPAHVPPFPPFHATGPINTGFPPVPSIPSVPSVPYATGGPFQVKFLTLFSFLFSFG